MTDRYEIARMAREAGWKDLPTVRLAFAGFDLERFAALVAAAERNRMIADGWRQCAQGQRTSQFCAVAEQARLEERKACAKVFAAAIRARGHAQVADRLARHGIPMPGEDNGRDPV